MKMWFKSLRKKECDRVRELLSPYIDDELHSEERLKVQAHLESCQSCREELESIRETVSLIRGMPVIEPRRSFTISETTKKIWDSTLRALSTATALVAVFLLVIFIGDIRHYFDAAPLPSPPWPQPTEVREYYWPVRETEFGLIGLIVVLATTALVYWRKRVQKLQRRK